MSSAAATSRTSRVRAGSRWMRSRNASCRCPEGDAGTVPSGCRRAVNAVVISMRASGFPRASSSTCPRSPGDRADAPGTLPTSDSAASRASGAGRSSGRPGACQPDSLRAANTRAMPSLPSRRAANSRVSAEAWSSHCASSTRHSSGASSARSVSSDRTANPTRNRSCPLGEDDADDRPSASRKARACGPGSASIRSLSSRSSRCSVEKGSSPCASMPAPRNTRIPDAADAACSSSADLPIPVSPSITSAPLPPSRTAASRSSSTMVSAVRPTSRITTAHTRVPARCAT